MRPKTERGGCFIYCIETNTESDKRKKQRNMFQMKEKDEPSGKQNINEVEISSFYDKELKLMVIKVLSDLGRTQ